MTFTTFLFIAIGLTLSWYPAKMAYSFIRFWYEARRQEEEKRHAARIEELRKKHEKDQARRERLNKNESGITGCYFGPSEESRQYELQAKALVNEIMRRCGATPLDKIRWPIQDPLTGQWRLATKEEEDARRKK
jgi:hypothetical protein